MLLCNFTLFLYQIHGDFSLALDDLITTAYVHESHYDDKPITFAEFESVVGVNLDSLKVSMNARLALSLHAAAQGSNSLCSLNSSSIREGIPNCIEGSIRFQHFGCDFHIDADLTGSAARLFECNKVTTIISCNLVIVED